MKDQHGLASVGKQSYLMKTVGVSMTRWVGLGRAFVHPFVGPVLCCELDLCSAAPLHRLFPH